MRSSRSPSISSRTGWTTRQGPHQGAQKSTSTGPSASRTSALKVASVTSVSLPVTGYRSPEFEVLRLFGRAQYFRKYSDARSGLRAGLPRRRCRSAARGTCQIASATIARSIFEAPTRRSRKTIGTSTTRKPGCDRPVGHLDLEGVAASLDRVEVDRLQHLAAEALEAAGQVVDLDPEHEPRVGAAAAADRPPQRPPVADPAAGDVARAEHQVGAAARPPAGAAGRRGRGRSRSPSRGPARRRRRAPGGSRRCRRGRALPCAAGAGRSTLVVLARRAGRRSRRCRRASCRRRSGSGAEAGSFARTAATNGSMFSASL